MDYNQCTELGVFKYSQLRHDEIRLLRILPSSSKNDLHMSLQVLPTIHGKLISYEALSYCWGDTYKKKSITVNGKRMRITASLHDALVAIMQGHQRAHRRKHRFTHWLHPAASTPALWADAICINQDDEEEKTEQVRRMWQIYHDAARVIVWLGSQKRHTTAAFKAVQQACTCPQAEITEWTGPWTWGIKDDIEDLCPQALDHPSLTKEALDGLLDLTSRPYFQRAWVIQEYSQASKTSIMCGSYTFDPVELYHATSVPSYRAHESQQAFVRLHGTWAGAKTAVGQDLDQIVALYFDGLCSDPRDKIFAMLGHPELRHSMLWPKVSILQVDYSMASHEILLCFLKGYDRAAGIPGFLMNGGPGLEDQADAVWSWFFRLCRSLHLPASKNWFRLFPDLDCSQLPDCIVLKGGRKISCNGMILKELTYPLHGVGLLLAGWQTDDARNESFE